MTDEQVEKIIRSNMMLQMNLAGIRADFEESLHRTWVELTETEILSTWEPHMKDGLIEFARAIEAKLKEKNT